MNRSGSSRLTNHEAVDAPYDCEALALAFWVVIPRPGAERSEAFLGRHTALLCNGESSMHGDASGENQHLANDTRWACSSGAGSNVA